MFFRRLIVFVFLTILTQIGGIIYILNSIPYSKIESKIKNKWICVLGKCISFLLLYSIATFLLVPMIAKPFGRVPLPLSNTHHLQPLTVLTCMLNRNYVRPELRDLTFKAAEEMHVKYPGTVTNYLDGNFPFINKFPLIPHLSHNDGKKLDLAFCYNNKATGQVTNDAPSYMGYGICEEPAEGEYNTAAECADKGYIQYSILTKVFPQYNKDAYTFNEQKTKDLIIFLTDQPALGKLFVEPHLKARLALTDPKISFHGCHAVRHDDHIHIQLK